MRHVTLLRALGAVAVACLLTAFVAGCSGLRSFGSSETGHHGYQVEGEEVVFEFHTNLYVHVTSSVIGDWTELEDHRIHKVVVAGEFNDWDPDAWEMQRVTDARYRLRRPREDFDGKDRWQFKFVVNGNQWVEPTPECPNRVDTGFMNKAFNLALELPG